MTSQGPCESIASLSQHHRAKMGDHDMYMGTEYGVGVDVGRVTLSIPPRSQQNGMNDLTRTLRVDC